MLVDSRAFPSSQPSTTHVNEEAAPPASGASSSASEFFQVRHQTSQGREELCPGALSEYLNHGIHELNKIAVVLCCHLGSGVVVMTLAN